MTRADSILHTASIAPRAATASGLSGPGIAYRPAAFWTSGGKSSIPMIWRTSMTGPSAHGARLAHSTASSFDFTSINQYPPITSLASENGPSLVLALPPGTDTRPPSELGCSPSSDSRTPALASSSLYFPMAATASADGIHSSSEMFGSMNTMNRMVTPLGSSVGLFSPAASNEVGRNRHLAPILSVPGPPLTRTQMMSVTH